MFPCAKRRIPYPDSTALHVLRYQSGAVEFPDLGGATDGHHRAGVDNLVRAPATFAVQVICRLRRRCPDLSSCLENLAESGGDKGPQLGNKTELPPGRALCRIVRYGYAEMTAWLPPDLALVTMICLSIRSLKSATWEMNPTSRSPSVRLSRAFIT